MGFQLICDTCKKPLPNDRHLTVSETRPPMDPATVSYTSPLHLTFCTFDCMISHVTKLAELATQARKTSS